MNDDYELWKMWWYAVLYGAGTERRMKVLDEQRLKRS